jgi:hypothetical protein
VVRVTALEARRAVDPITVIVLAGNPRLVVVTGLDLLLQDGLPAVSKNNLTRAEEVRWAVTEASAAV